MSQTRQASPEGGEPAAAASPEVVVVGRLVETREAADRRMIALVRARPLLYARSDLPVASCYAHVKRLWKEVADEMGWSVAEVRRKWSHVRNSYSRHLRNEMGGARTGRGRAVSRWYLADELAFLRDHMATDTRASARAASPYCRPLYVESGEAAQPWYSGEEAEGASVQAQVTLLEPKLEPGGGAPTYAHTYAHAHAPDGSSCGSQSVSTPFGPDEDGPYWDFFRGLHADYTQLSARAQRLFKRQCLTLLYDLLDAEETTPSTPLKLDTIK